MANDERSSQIVCRFCLCYSLNMWPLELVYKEEKTFLEKVFQCSQINIIDLDELHTWVCDGCLQNIEKFYAFRVMLQRNLTDFNDRFRAEQQELHNATDWNDNHLVEVFYDDFSDCDDCYEMERSDSEEELHYNGSVEEELLVADSRQESGVKDGSTEIIPFQEVDIKIEFTETTLKAPIETSIVFETPANSTDTELIKCEICQKKFPVLARTPHEETTSDHICVLPTIMVTT